MRESKVLKLISYVAIPILIGVLILSVLYGFDKKDYENTQVENVSYFNTDAFLNNYMTILSKETENLIYRNAQYKYIQDGEYTIYYKNTYGEIDYSNYTEEFKDFYYVIIYKQKVYTNVELTTKTNTLEELKEYVSRINDTTKIANIINGNVEADSEVISTKAIQFFDNFKNTYYTKDLAVVTPEIIVAETEEQIEEIKESEDPQEEKTPIVEEKTPENNYTYITTQIQDFQIFSSYKTELVETTSNKNLFYINLLHNLQKYEDYMNYAIPTCAVLLIISILYLIISIGRVKGKKYVDLNDFDKVFLEIILVIAAGIVIGVVIILSELLVRFDDLGYQFLWSCLVTGYLVLYTVIAATGTTIVKRIKAKTLLKDSMIGRFFKLTIKILRNIGKNIKAGFNKIVDSWSISKLLIIYTTIYLVIMVVLIVTLEGVGAILDVLITFYLLYKLIERVTCLERIETHLKKMYEGNYAEKLEGRDFTKEFQKTVVHINDISNGFEKAIQKGIQSERLKTELITNVSHDIKTPLTSIINYVDLLKKENIQNEKAKEYLEVLENKSQRLKKLTEDLVEASKASSGNIKLDIRKIKLTQLIKQSIGEFEDKFESKGLEIITDYPKQDVYILADNRCLYRVIENLFVNISKYALEKSRVYIQVEKGDEKVILTIKNISKDSLNISADELMQRFVRGDKSRTTEGSGLGLSISKSLTELQKGKFDLEVDGDLFKVRIEFKTV